MSLPYPLILASSSKYRQLLLKQLGFEFRSLSPEVNEDEIKAKSLSPREISLELSRKKAEVIFSQNQQACVIGSDQVCHLEGRLMGKPHTPQGAEDQLYLLQGKKHELLTAVTLLSPAGEKSFVNHTTLYMRPLSKEEIRIYVKEDLPLDCAGSYKLESRGIKLFSKIEMTDHTAIIGLPLIELTTHLLSLGYPL